MPKIGIPLYYSGMSAHFPKFSFLREGVMVGLAIFSVVLLILEVYTFLSPSPPAWLNIVDIIISALFFADFFLHYHLSPDKKDFFPRHRLELISAIPAVGPMAQLLQGIPLFPGVPLLYLLRLIRLAIRMRILLEFSLEYARNSYLIFIFTTACIVVFSGAAGFFFFEFGINPNVHSYWDAVWWAIVSATTTGYGDIYPITTGGRLVAIAVIIIGFASVAALIAIINSIMLENHLKNHKNHCDHNR